MSNVIWISEPKARIAHRCSCCGRSIEPGETYLRARSVYEGDPYTWKECRHCRAFVRMYIEDFAYDYHEGYTADDIREWEPETPEAIEHKRQWMNGWRTSSGDLHINEPRKAPEDAS